MSFYNTTNETAEVLRQNKIKAESQAVKIIAWFEAATKANPAFFASPSIVHRMLFDTKKTPLTSVRRSICDLTKIGLIRKTSIKSKGRFERLEFCWELNTTIKVNHSDR